MADYAGMGVAAYMLSFTLIRRLEAKGLLTRAEAEELIANAIQQLQGPRETELKQAQSILEETLNIVHEGDNEK